MTTEEEFQTVLSKLDHFSEPKDTVELVAYIGALSDAIEKCERLVLYLATSPSRSEDLITYLFEYKQLLSLERRMNDMRYTLHPPAPKEEKAPAKKPWWRLGA